MAKQNADPVDTAVHLDGNPLPRGDGRQGRGRLDRKRYIINTDRPLADRSALEIQVVDALSRTCAPRERARPLA